MTVSDRAPGFYWVFHGYSHSPFWRVAEWDGGDWLFTRSGCGNAPVKIGPRVITPPQVRAAMRVQA